MSKIRIRRGGVLGGGLEPPCLAAYAPQTYVSAISPPERVESEDRGYLEDAGSQVLVCLVSATGRTRRGELVVLPDSSARRVVGVRRYR